MGELGAQGNWYLPGSETAVPSHGDGGQSGFYRNRDLGKVRLNRRSEATSLTGLFRCTIPDSSGQNLTFFIGAYSNGDGEILYYQKNFTYFAILHACLIGRPSVQSLEIDRDNITLTCISSGGPATNVIWTKQGTPVDENLFNRSQRVLDIANATYENVLSTNNRENVVGFFSCTVCNSRGCDSRLGFSHGNY